MNPVFRDHEACLHGDPKRPACILCGKCLDACPLFQATGREELAPKAKFFLADALLAKREGLKEKEAVQLADLCLACGRCEKACPRGLCAPDLVSQLRAAHPDWTSFVWEKWVQNARALWPLAVALARFAPKALPASRSVAAMDPKQAAAPWLRPVSFGGAGAGMKVVTFLGCVAEHARTDWKVKTRGLLAGLGVETLPAPGFSCCGCTLGHAGLFETQLAMRRANITAWREAGRPTMVVICATCRCGLRAYGAQFTEFEPGEAQKWRDSVVSLSDLLGGTEFEVLENAPAEVVYHKPCHGAGGDQDLNFLRRVLGERLRFLTGTTPCCGFGGMMQLTAPGLSAKVAKQAFAAYALASGAQVLTGCSGCVTQLSAHAPEGVLAGHWLDAICLPAKSAYKNPANGK